MNLRIIKRAQDPLEHEELLVHELQEMRAAKEIAEARLKQAIDLYQATPIAQLSLSRDGSILLANRAAEQLLAAPAGGLSDRRLADLLPGTPAAGIDRVLSEADAGCARAVADLECEQPAAGRSARRLRLEAVPAGDGKRFACVLTDISAIHRSEHAIQSSEMLFRTFSDFTYDWEYWDGAQHVIHYMTPSCERVTGYRAAQFVEDPDLLKTIVHPDDRPLWDAYLDGFARREDRSFKYRIRRRDGDTCWIAHESRVVVGPGDEFLGRRVSNRDITLSQRAEDALHMACVVLNSMNAAVMVTDADNHIVMVNPAFTAITGYLADEVLGEDPRILSSKDRPATFYRNLWASLEKTNAWRGEIDDRHKSGRRVTIDLSISVVRDADSHIYRHVAVFTDISARKLADEKLFHLAHFDTLTDLPNRLLIIDRLGQALTSARRAKQRVGVLYVDLDGFKPINDVHGRDAGDEVLREVANRLRFGVRDSDTVARIGDDEFVILLPRIESEADAVLVANKILKAFAEPITVNSRKIRVDASIGLATFPEHGCHQTNLVDNAGRAMSQAKRGGGGQLISASDLPPNCQPPAAERHDP